MTWCLISREFPPFSGGGIGTYARAFTQSLVMAREKPVVITMGEGPRTERVEEGVRVIRLPLAEDEDWSRPHPAARTPETLAAWNALGPHAVFAMQVADVLQEIISKYEIDLVEFADTGAAGWFALNRRRNLCVYGDVRMITHVHSPSAWVEELNRRLEPGRAMHELQKMEMEQARWSDAVITPSNYMANWVRTNWNVEPSVIPYPLPAPVDELRSDEEDGVLFVGRLEYRKGIDTLCNAWSKLKPGHIRLHLVGHDTTDERTGVPIGERLLSEMPREASLTVVEHGPMDPAHVRALQNEASVIVVPSPADNFPYTCIEAMASGRVVVASDVGGAAELIEDGVSGLLFEAGSCESLAVTLKRAMDLSPNDRAMMGEKAGTRVGDVCRVSRVVELRREHARRIEHWRDILSDADCVFINASQLTREDRQRLCDAVTASRSDFAIGWVRTGRGILAQGTPSFAGLLAGPREVGPIAMRRKRFDALETTLTPDDVGDVSCRESWRLLAKALHAGAKGVVVPEVIVDSAEPAGETPPIDVHAMIGREIVTGEPGLPVGRALRLAPAFEEQTDTIKARVMGTARKLLGG